MLLKHRANQTENKKESSPLLDVVLSSPLSLHSLHHNFFQRMRGRVELDTKRELRGLSNLVALYRRYLLLSLFTVVTHTSTDRFLSQLKIRLSRTLEINIERRRFNESRRQLWDRSTYETAIVIRWEVSATLVEDYNLGNLYFVIHSRLAPGQC